MVYPREQGELFTRQGFVPTAEAVGGEVMPASPEQAARLCQALDYYDTAALLYGQIEMYENPAWLRAQEKRYPTKGVVYKIRRDNINKFQLALDNARHEFEVAYGLDAVLAAADDESRDVLQAQVDAQYQEFESTFRGSGEARQEKRRRARAYYMQQIIGGTAIEESDVLEASAFPPEDPDRRVSLARALRPEFMHLDAQRYGHISDEAVRAVSPPELGQELVDVKKSLQNILYFNDPDSRKRRYTAFSPAEWAIMLRTRTKFPADVAFNQSEATQHQKPPEERDIDAPRRSRIHVAEGKVKAMATYVDGVLNQQLDLLDRFLEASQYHGGLARFGNEATMREQTDYLWDVVIGDMLWAARVARGGVMGEEDDDRLALEKGIYFAPNHTTRLDRFVTVLNLAKGWIEDKKAYMTSQANEANVYSARHQLPVTDFKRAAGQ